MISVRKFDPPSYDRHWRPEVAVMPRAAIDGDRVRLTGVRNFDYRSRCDFTVRHEERLAGLLRVRHRKSPTQVQYNRERCSAHRPRCPIVT